MRIVFLLVLVLTGLSWTSPALAADAPAPSEPRPPCLDEDPIIARVNGVPITDTELKQACSLELRVTEYLAEPERSARQRQIARRELDKLVERELILQEARSRMKGEPGALAALEAMAAAHVDKVFRGYMNRMSTAGFPCETDEQLKEVLRSQGMTLDSLRRYSERGFMAMEYMRLRIDKALSKRPEKVALAGYHVELEREYRRIVARLRKQASIEILWPDYDKSDPDAATPPPAGHWRVKINISSPQPGSPPP